MLKKVIGFYKIPYGYPKSQPPSHITYNDEYEMTRLKAIPVADQQPFPFGKASTARIWEEGDES